MTRLSVVAADTLVLAITWRHTYRLKKEASSAYITFPFLALLLEHGVVFFLLLTSLNLMQICTQLISPPEIDSTNLADLVSVFIIPTSSILISRKILHLRNVIDVHDLSPDEFQDPEYSDPLQSLSFTTASNLEDDADAYEHGEPLDSATQARGYDGIPLDYLKDCSSTVCGIGD
ncbi:hypothetical protein WOLCODRAFT_161962 [Wolfiporia cocos MD-104 SS10]|uniref:Uncharacterized protein n=1 Tax=Wolfiporia cocos (strain MD-104) TaxID=742152 RepID=A0A2H3JT93_WOLCO|nr:hypothetical protein WOLCODRAFT_161962 [Wolfiporia cocos MD-104 SS10]